MQQITTNKNRLSRIGTGLVLLIALITIVLMPGENAWAQKSEMTPALMANLYPAAHITFPDRPDFLDCTSNEAAPEKREEETIRPFFGADRILPPLSHPERPAISVSDEELLLRPDVTAGVHVNFGTVKFNLGYTLPSRQVDGLIRPLGVDLQPGTDDKCFSLGVKIPFF